MADFDIVTLILAEHDTFRRSFTALEELTDTGELHTAWQEIADQLEVHASAEEVVFYPQLLKQVPGEEGDTKHAVHDHNEIRDACRAVDGPSVGTDQWWEAVRNARAVTAEHLEEEEHEVLPPFKETVSAELRDELGMTWLEYHDKHEGARGLSGDDKDPDAYVAERT